ncbi:MAG: hypothetical protein JSV33_05250 [bacterium]|nr:MAG: hypothetical protein JSV33_05250 [bacterium]
MLKNSHIWLWSYIAGRLRRRRLRYPLRILLAIADHFEPEQKPGDPLELQIKRVHDWITRYEKRYTGFKDCTGRPPVHTYFFPEEQYAPETVEPLAEHCARGFGEVEIHIHHDYDAEDAFREKMNVFRDRLAEHGLLCRDSTENRVKYGFVHGNWSLDNSRRDGRWCGLNNEITLLRDTGCYADFTLPSAPSECQTTKINSIYFAIDDPVRPKSHDTGVDVTFGGKTDGDLLMIQGPLALNWNSRIRGIVPRIENADINGTNPVTQQRIKLWIDQRILVPGVEDVVFVKLHTHGLKSALVDYLVGEELARGFELLEREFNDGNRFRLYYVTAREMANIVLAFNDGVLGPISELKDYRLKSIR